MAALILPSRRVWQPQGPVEVDHSNPDSAGLLLAVNHAVGLVNFARRGVITPSGNQGVLRARRSGLQLESFAYVFSYTPPAALTAATIYSVESLPGDSGGPWRTNETENDFTPFSDGNIYLNTFASSRYISGVPFASYADRNGFVVAARGSGVANSHAAFINGRKIGTANSAFVCNPSIQFGSNGYSSGSSSALRLLFDRAHTDEQIARISRNPWALFRPIQRRIMVAVPSGGTDATAAGVTLAVSASLTAGTAAGVRNGTAAGATLAPSASLSAGAAIGAVSATAKGRTIRLGAFQQVLAYLAGGIAANFTLLTPSPTYNDLWASVADAGGGLYLVNGVNPAGNNTPLPDTFTFSGYYLDSGDTSGSGDLTFYYDTIDLVPGAAAGQVSASASGVTVTAQASLAAGAAAGQIAATAAGAAVSASASLVAGTATGTAAATAAGVTLAAQAALVPGAASGGSTATAAGASLSASAQLVPGAASGVVNATAPAALVAVSAQLVPGAASGQANGTAPGATLQAGVSATWGSASGSSASQAPGAALAVGSTLVPGNASAVANVTAGGATLVATTSVVAGAAQGGFSASAPGATVSAQASVAAGQAAGQTNASATSATLGTSASLAPGAASATRSATQAGALLPVSASIQAGGAAGQGNVTAFGAFLEALVSFVPGNAATLASDPSIYIAYVKPVDYVARVRAESYEARVKPAEYTATVR